MSIDEIKQFAIRPTKLHLIDVLIEQRTISPENAATLREAADAVKTKEVTIAAVARWLNSKEGVSISEAAVRNWLQAQQ
jgi:hypothetical protein